ARLDRRSCAASPWVWWPRSSRGTFRQALAAFKIAPALAAGNTVILKPCPETALEDYIWADAAEAGLPEGVLNIVMGDRDAGAPTTRTSGLAGVVYSADEDHALDVARQIRSGTVGLNYYLLDIGSPYGGYQESGLGREL